MRKSGKPQRRQPCCAQLHERTTTEVEKNLDLMYRPHCLLRIWQALHDSAALGAQP